MKKISNWQAAFEGAVMVFRFWWTMMFLSFIVSFTMRHFGAPVSGTYQTDISTAIFSTVILCMVGAAMSVRINISNRNRDDQEDIGKQIEKVPPRKERVRKPK